MQQEAVALLRDIDIYLRVYAAADIAAPTRALMSLMQRVRKNAAPQMTTRVTN
jgi:hypothetical protein